jgi:hypothetical protein
MKDRSGHAKGLYELDWRHLLETNPLSERLRENAREFDVADFDRPCDRNDRATERLVILKNLYNHSCDIDCGNGHEADFWIEWCQVAASADLGGCV